MFVHACVYSCTSLDECLFLCECMYVTSVCECACILLNLFVRCICFRCSVFYYVK